MKTLTERRKADREKMAEAVLAVALELGAAAEIENQPFGDIEPQTIMVRIRTDRGLCLNVDFNGASSQPDIHVLSWHIASDVDTRLADAFGLINPHHFQKATDTAAGLDALLSILRRRLAQCADGSAYSAEREAAAIAKHGTAAERNAEFAAWRAEMVAEREGDAA